MNEILIHKVTYNRERNLSKPLFVATRKKSVCGKFVLAEESPVCLLGRDLLQPLDTEKRLLPETVDLIIMGMIVNTESTDKESYEEFKIPEILKYSKKNFGNNAFTGSWDLKLTQKDVGTMEE